MTKVCDVFITPMLAKKVILNKLTFTLYVQPKLDGFRCMSHYKNVKVVLLSRNNLPYKGLQTLKHKLLLSYENLNNKNSLYLDGELFISDIPFNEFSGFIKRAQNHADYDIKNIEFRIFDYFDTKNTGTKIRNIRKLHFYNS